MKKPFFPMIALALLALLTLATTASAQNYPSAEMLRDFTAKTYETAKQAESEIKPALARANLLIKELEMREEDLTQTVSKKAVSLDELTYRIVKYGNSLVDSRQAIVELLNPSKKVVAAIEEAFMEDMKGNQTLNTKQMAAASQWIEALQAFTEGLPRVKMNKELFDRATARMAEIK